MLKYKDFIKESYKEIEFVCHNSKYPNSTSKESQIVFYNKLKSINGIYPYIQDFSDEKHIQKSLAVIILNKSKEKELINIILKLSKEYNIEFDIFNNLNDKQVDDIIKNDNQFNIKESFIKRIKQYNISPIEINNGYCEGIAYDILKDIGGETENTYILDDGFFWSSKKISKYKSKGGDYWNMKNMEIYGIPPFDLKYLSKFDLNGHTWIYNNIKHYDAECLDGVDNFWNLPIYIKQLKNLMN